MNNELDTRRAQYSCVPIYKGDLVYALCWDVKEMATICRLCVHLPFFPNMNTLTNGISPTSPRTLSQMSHHLPRTIQKATDAILPTSCLSKNWALDLLVHTFRHLQVPRPITAPFSQPFRKSDDPRLTVRIFCPMPKLVVVVLRHCLFEKPLLGGSPHFDRSEVPTVLWVFEDVEKQAVRFLGACRP
jgi:hypothetical protein